MGLRPYITRLSWAALHLANTNPPAARPSLCPTPMPYCAADRRISYSKVAYNRSYYPVGQGSPVLPPDRDLFTQRRGETVWKIAESLASVLLGRQKAADRGSFGPSLRLPEHLFRATSRFSKQFLTESSKKFATDSSGIHRRPIRYNSSVRCAEGSICDDGYCWCY